MATILPLIEEKLLPFVEKPARYIGCEPGLYKKEPGGKFQIALAYPDLYEIGMSYTGGQLLYHLINSRDDALCERVYAVAHDAEARMRQAQIELFSLETHRPIKEFDLFGFTLSYEMVFTNMLNMIDLAGIPVKSTDRSDDDPLIVAGGPIVYNPEPVADFVDFFFIGEVEDSMPELISIYESNRHKSRKEKLLALSKIEAIYVPSLYDPKTRAPLSENIPAKIKAARVAELKPENYPTRPLMALLETAHDRVSIEIMRGCPQGCRFCQAGRVYKPVRVRSVADIKQQAIEAIEATGYEEIGLLSLSTSDYPDIENLIITLSAELDKKKISLSFPSLRPASFTSRLATAASRLRKTGITFAPEVGTERMRKVVNKNVTESDLLTAVDMIFEKGWKLVKLYFMIGLPTETDEDIDGIIDLINKVVQIGNRHKGLHKINVTISPFSPKSHTPLQWDEVSAPDETRRKYAILRSAIRAKNVKLKLRKPELSYLEGVLGRGDRRLGQVIYTAWKNGARFDGWSEYFNYSIWSDAFESCSIDPNDYARTFSFSEPLPWDHIERGRSREFLQKEREQSSFASADPLPMMKPEKESLPPPTNSDADMYGRKNKKVITASGAVSPTRGKVRIQWGKKGLVRFLSHLDNNRIFQRAIRLSGLPVVMSQGFNPHQKLSFGPPLPLGYSSDSEFLDIHIDGNVTPAMMQRFDDLLPDGYFLVDYKLIYTKAPAISALLNRAIYHVTGDISLLSETDCLTKLMEQKSIIFDRPTGDGFKKIDIRPAIYSIGVTSNGEGPFLEMELGLGTGGYARPREVLETMDLFDQESLTSLHFHRQKLQYLNSSGNYLDPLEAIL